MVVAVLQQFLLADGLTLVAIVLVDLLMLIQQLPVLTLKFLGMNLFLELDRLITIIQQTSSRDLMIDSIQDFLVSMKCLIMQKCM